MILDPKAQLSFYANMLMQMQFRKTKEIQTAGVMIKEGKITFAYNQEFLDKLTYPQAVYLVQHEIMHVVFKHHMRSRSEKISRRDNAAMDLAVNSWLGEPPMDGLYPGQGEFKKLPQNKSYERYFIMLPKDEPPQGGGGSGLEGADAGPGQQDNNGSVYDSIPQNTGRGAVGDWETHTMKGNDALSEVACNNILTEAVNKSRGNMPAGLEEVIKKSMIARVNWKQELKKFVGEFHKMGTKPTLMRENRRLPLWGIIPGKQSKYSCKLLVAIDTSASVSSQELAAFIGEISKIVIPITLVQCDTKINETIEVRNPRVLLHKDFKAKGRGGTEFNPVFELAKKKKYHGVVYLTDMECPYPERKLKRRTLWISTQSIDSIEKPPFGKVVHMDIHDGKGE